MGQPASYIFPKTAYIITICLALVNQAKSESSENYQTKNSYLIKVSKFNIKMECVQI